MDMETWMPERLPARFEPRSRRHVLGAPQRAWRPLAVGVAVLLGVGFLFARQSAPAGVTTAVHVVASTAARFAPAPAPAATPVPTAAARTVQPVPAAPARQPAPPATTAAVPSPVPSAATTTEQPSPTAEPTPTAEPSGLLQQVLPQPKPAQSPGPSPSPSRFCLPLNLLCL
jgi:outer membrane biosynthesis protein TonB